MTAEARPAAVRAAITDLHHVFDDGRALEERDAPARSRSLARSLFDAVQAADGADAHPGTLRERIVTDAVLRGEADRDQNVYLGTLFTRTLTRAVPDLLFQPASMHEAAAALRWARAHAVPLALRGAASTAMGGAVAHDGGLVLDTARLDQVEIDERDGVCVIGAGARLRDVHRQLAGRGLALPVYPSNLGGTFAGWFATGGIGMNAFGHGRALDHVRAVDVLLPSGEHLRFHDDGRLDVPAEDHRRITLPAGEAAAWFRGRDLEALTLRDLAGSEGVFGLILQLAVRVQPRTAIGAFLLAFERRDAALAAVDWIAAAAGERFDPPANVKLVSGSHLHHTRTVWADEDAREWRTRPGTLSGSEQLPWTRIEGPAALGAAVAPDPAHAEAYLFVDFLGLEGARAFAGALGECPGGPVALAEESVRFARERFRPQQTKRLGPGLLAAEILMPAEEVPHFLPRAERLARRVGKELDAEVYWLADRTVLVIGGYLVDHRRGDFALDLMIAPALLDLAMHAHRGTPYVLGRWQSAWARRKLGSGGLDRLRTLKRGLDPGAIVNRGVLLEFELRGGLGRIVTATFAPAVTALRTIYGSGALAWTARLAKGVLAPFGGPAAGRGEPAQPGAAQSPTARAIGCVNCGECNSVCPIFHESKIRLPQMLTHVGEALHGGGAIGGTGSALLDLCMRCGNCEEVCQAGIPHLPLYARMQQASDAVRPPDRERHVAILTALRGSPRYTRDFLHARPGGYLKRAAASLPGVARYVLLRAENDAGPAATCIHCGACVAVCPTQANREFEGLDPRWITTEQHRCIGCGTCVEVCPANHANGGQTLRVLEAPAREFFVALEAFDKAHPEPASSPASN